MPLHSKRIDRTKPVAYLQGDGNYTTLHYPDGTSAMASLTIRDVCSWQPDLIRIHKGLAVNPKYVLKWIRLGPLGLTLTVACGKSTILLETSRRLATPTEHALRDYVYYNSLTV